MRVVLCVALLAIAILHAIGTRAEAAEAATAVYIFGSRTVGAGVTPPAGIYFQDHTYFDSGKIGGAVQPIKAKL